MESARDKNGKTEREFLRDYDVTRYFRPSVTVDAVLYRRTPDGLRALMIKRGGHPFLGSYAFPGGFVERDESCEQAVERELYEETGIRGVALRQLVAASTPDRDPRWRNITVVFCAEIDDDLTACAGDDASEAVWFDVKFSDDGTLCFFGGGDAFDAKLEAARDAFGDVDLNRTRITERGKTAFDHAKIVYLLADRLHRGVL